MTGRKRLSNATTRALRFSVAAALVAALGAAASPLPVTATPVRHRIGVPVTVGTQGNEPNMLVAPDGTLYISALQYLYVSTDDGKTWTQSPGSTYSSQLEVASDSSIALDPGGRLYFTFDYPYVGVTAVCTSDDRAQNFACDPKTVPGGTDRMWVVAPSNDAAYLVTNEGLYQTLFFKSTDRGQTWTLQGTVTKGANSNTGPMIESPESHLIFQPFTDNASNQTATNNFDSGPLGFHVYDGSSATATELTTPLTAGAALPTAGFTRDGTLYLASDVPGRKDDDGNLSNVKIVVARSRNEGAKWKKLKAVPGTGKGIATFTALATGKAGHVGVLYYYTATPGIAAGVPADASWDVRWAETWNANSRRPRWTVQTVERDVHHGPICSTAGCSGNDRFAGDFIAAAFDARDRPHLTWVAQPQGGSPVVRYAGAAR